MKTPYATLTATAAFGLLSACLGAGNATSSMPRYETFDSTADTTSKLGGVALRSDGTTGVLDVTTTSGSMTHSTGSTTIADGTYNLTDSDGFDANGNLTDGSSTLAADGTQGFTGTYEYVRSYEQTYTSPRTIYDSFGIVGVVTSGADVPTSGSANYNGEAVGTVITSTQGFDLKNGNSTVTAKFRAGKVDVTMNGFTAIDQSTGNAATAPIDTISATGMTIRRNGFGGGNVTTTNGGIAVDVTGANTTSEARGAFFGFDAGASAPDEVGGLVLRQGDNGMVGGVFIAD